MLYPADFLYCDTLNGYEGVRDDSVSNTELCKAAVINSIKLLKGIVVNMTYIPFGIVLQDIF